MTSPQGTLAVPLANPEAVEALAAFGRFASARGWLAATSGNFSCRLDAAHALVTRSGIDKGAIGAGRRGGRPDRRTDPARDVGRNAAASCALPRRSAAIGAILHVHTVAATVLSRADARRAAACGLSGFEMQKALAGIATHEGVVDLPVFANDQDTAALATAVEARLERAAGRPGYLLAGHGLYAWGATMADARRHLEGLEFLLACTLEERRLQR